MSQLIDGNTSNIPMMEKYRPKTLDTVHEHQFVKDILKTFLETGEMPHLLFNGPAGTGKTSSIRALGFELFGEHYPHMMMELNGSDERGISVIREKIKQFAVTRNMLRPNYPKLIILDEADSMTYDAQFALRRIIELYTKNVRFIFICNWEHKIIDAIKSRCLVYRFNRLKPATIQKQMETIIAREKILGPKKGKAVAECIGKLVQGDMRFAFNILEQIKYVSDMKTTDIINHVYYVIYGLTLSDMNDLHENIVNRKQSSTVTETIDILRDLGNKHSLNLSSMISILCNLAKQHKQYNFMKMMAGFNYNFCRVNYSNEKAFLMTLAVLLDNHYMRNNA